MLGERRIDVAESSKASRRRIGQAIQLRRDQRPADAPARLDAWSERPGLRHVRQLQSCFANELRCVLRKARREVGLDDGEYRSSFVRERGSLQLHQRALEPSEQNFVVATLAFVQPDRPHSEHLSNFTKHRLPNERQLQRPELDELVVEFLQ